MTLEEFKKLTNKLSLFCTAPTDTWKRRILFKSIKDEEFAKLVNDILDNIKDMTSDEINNIFNKIRDLSEISVEKIKEERNPIEKYRIYTDAEVYYGLIEQIDELSSFSDEIGKELYSKYGNEGVAEIDKMHPSKLTDFNLTENDKDIEDELVKKYLVLKKWQDLQHIYSINVLDEICHAEELEELIEAKLSQKLGIKDNARNLLELYDIANNPLIGIDLISKYYLAGLKDNLALIIGGKGYGLGILNIYSDVPETYIIPTTQKYNQNSIDDLTELDKWSVRSSANVEDGKENSFAGMFSSYLNIDKKDLEKMFLKVKESVYSERVISYVKTKKTAEPKMAVIIQKYIEPEYAGVWLGHDLEDGVYELVKGNGEKLVSGEASPFQFTGEKDQKLKEYFTSLQKKLNAVADFEWCIIDGKLIMLQYRPVTTKIKRLIPHNDGYGVSSGIASGDICFIPTLNEQDKFEEGKILLTYLTDPEWTPMIMKSKGVVTAIGGYLCHTAIITRELGIPCVTNIGIDRLNELKKLKEITIDGDSGIIKSKKKQKVLR